MHTSPCTRAALSAVATAVVVVLLGCSTGPDQHAASQPAPEATADQVHQAQQDAEPGTQDDSGEGEHHEDDGPADEEFIAELSMVDAPEEMGRQDDTGASAAAEYFLFAYTYAYGTGDVGPVEQMASPECGFCASVVAGAREAHAEDTYMRSGDPVITGVQVGPSEEDGVDYLVWVEAQLPQMRTFDADHAVVEIHPASDIAAGFSMVHDGDAWLVLGATFEAGS